MSPAQVWCRTYTLLVPDEERKRRRAEVASHVHEARHCGVSGARLMAEALLGAGADLAWSDGVRRRRGLLPLAVAPFVDATSGAVLAVPVMAFSYLWSLVGIGPVHDGLGRGVSLLALALIVSGRVVGFARRWRR